MAHPFQLHICGRCCLAQQKCTRPVKVVASESSGSEKDKAKHPERYERNRQQDVLCCRFCRLQLTDIERIHWNNLAAIRQRWYRKRQREKLVAETGRKEKEHGDKILTRSTLQKIYYRWKKQPKSWRKSKLFRGEGGSQSKAGSRLLM